MSTTTITLQYGQRVLFPAYPLKKSFFSSHQTTVDKPTMIEMEIKKYWEKDLDANTYKVSLHPIDTAQAFGVERIYSQDLKSMIREGRVKLIQ